MSEPLERGVLGRRFLPNNVLDRLEGLERNSRGSARSSLGLAAASENYSRRYLLEGWYDENVGGTITAVTLSRFAGLSMHDGVAFPMAGTVKRLLLYSNAARTAGTLEVEVYLDGAAMGMIATLDDTVTQWVEEGGEGVPFEAGELITLRITTVGWTPTSADLQASIEVELS